VKIRLPLIVALLAALGLPAVAQASLKRVTDHADAGSVKANGCQVTKAADHSLSVRCPAGHAAVISWGVLGPALPHVSVSSKHPCRYQPHVRDMGRFHGNDHVYKITQRVHHNTIVSMTATFG
jgi:hypothetical protein